MLFQLIMWKSSSYMFKIMRQVFIQQNYTTIHRKMQEWILRICGFVQITGNIGKKSRPVLSGF